VTGGRIWATAPLDVTLIV